MKTIFFLVLLTAGSLAEGKTPIPRSVDSYTWRLTGGSGFDQEILRVHGYEEDFQSGEYHIRFNVNRKQVIDYHLPEFTITEYCGWHRDPGGSVGDYKPKDIRIGFWMGDGINKLMVYKWGQEADYNVNPFIMKVNVEQRGSRLRIPDWIKNVLLVQACAPTGSKSIILTWEGFTACRWKPEAWHKPVHFPFQYNPPLNAQIERVVQVRCEY